MLRDDGRAVRLPQRTVQPLQPLCAQLAARLSRHRRVEHHQPHLEIVDGVLQEAVHSNQISVLSEKHVWSARGSS